MIPLLRGIVSHLLLLVCACLQSSSVRASDSLKVLFSRPMSARMLTNDELGNIYVLHQDNTVARYNERGDSTGFYRSALNGRIGMIDATNPLRLLLYFPAFNKVEILDRQLTLKAELDLRPLHIFTPTAVATASDGNIWIYDPFGARILKLDETGARLSESVDLRQQLPFVPKAAFLLERDRRLYLCDTAKGVLVFDQFATYVNTLPLYGQDKIQAFDQQLVFYRRDTLHRYDLLSFGEKSIPISITEGNAIDASLNLNRLVVLTARQLLALKLP